MKTLFRMMRAALVLDLLVCLACSATVPPSPTVYSPRASWLGEGGNETRLSYYNKNESRFYRSNAKDLPKVCLALSGGGMRAAAFSIGVMSGLHDLGALQKVDVASAVSGGGYALSWYTVQHYDRWRDQNDYDPVDLDNELFASDLVKKPHNRSDWKTPYYQRHLEQNFELFNLQLGTRAGKSRTLGQGFVSGVATGYNLFVGGLATLVSIPVNFFANGVFGWHANVVPTQVLYENSIERAFFSNPERSNIGWGFGVGAFGRSDRVEYQELEKWLSDLHPVSPGSEDATAVVWGSASERRHVMYPIHNAMLNLDAAYNLHANDLANRQFEFSPLRAGIDSIGYYKPAEYLTVYDRMLLRKGFSLSRATAVSGAAVDTEALLESSREMFASALNMDLGMHMRNPRILPPNVVRRPKKQLFHPLWIFPIYFGTGWANDIDGYRLYVSDGGHSENLGLFPVARRLCEKIIIVDSEADSEFTFSSYRIARAVLERDLGMRLEVEAFDRWLTARDVLDRVLDEAGRMGLTKSNSSSDVKPPEDRAALLREDLCRLRTLLKENYRPEINCATEPLEVLIGQQVACLPDAVPLDREKLGQYFLPEYVFDGSEPVSEGKIVLPNGAPEGRKSLDVYYVKLTIAEQDCAPKGDGKRSSYSDAVCEYRKLSVEQTPDAPFPFQGTGDIAYDEYQYRAYRELGREAVHKVRSPLVKRSSPETSCQVSR